MKKYLKGILIRVRVLIWGFNNLTKALKIHLFAIIPPWSSTRKTRKESKFQSFIRVSRIK